ncbi:hypothetical protein V1506DRAFT_524422 [Lipomyces tetrasporus]
MVELRNRKVVTIVDPPAVEEAEQQQHEEEEEEEAVVAVGERVCALCGLSLASSSTLRRHLRDYHHRAVVDRKERRRASARGPVTATLVVQEGRCEGQVDIVCVRSSGFRARSHCHNKLMIVICLGFVLDSQYTKWSVHGRIYEGLSSLPGKKIGSCLLVYYL